MYHLVCPDGYSKKIGQIDARGALKIRITKTKKECKRECDANKDCVLFEYSPHEKSCKLHNSSQLVNYKYSNSILCSKGEDSCPMGYNLQRVNYDLDSQMTNLNYSTTHDNCRRDCDRNIDCKAFQYIERIPACRVFTTELKPPKDQSNGSLFQLCAKGNYTSHRFPPIRSII